MQTLGRMAHASDSKLIETRDLRDRSSANLWLLETKLVGGWKAKVAVAAVVLILGIQTALLFRPDGQADLPEGDVYHEELVLKKHGSPYFLAESRPQAEVLGDAPAPRRDRSSEDDHRRSRAVAPLVSIAPLDRAGMAVRGSNLDGSDAGPPRISLSYPGLSDTAADQSFAVNWPVAAEDWADSADAGLETLGPEQVVHIVADGDTLMKLAARYLGDAARQIEIFDANRSVLTSPEVLPIGAHLIMPSRSHSSNALQSPAVRPDDTQWRPVPTGQN